MPDYPSIAVAGNIESTINQLKHIERPVTHNNIAISSLEAHSVKISADPMIILKISEIKTQAEHNLFNDESAYFNQEPHTSSTSLSTNNEIDSASFFSNEPLQKESTRCEPNSAHTTHETKTQTQL